MRMRSETSLKTSSELPIEQEMLQVLYEDNEEA